MSYLDHIHQLNIHDLSQFVPFRVGTHQVGWVRPSHVDQLLHWSEIFRQDTEGLRLDYELSNPQQRTDAVDEVIRELMAGHILPAHQNEPYPVCAQPGSEPLFLIDRSAVAFFGIQAYGQHLNAYVRDGERLLMWIGRRAMDRWHSPGKLDNLVAGGLPYGISPADNLAKECWEEAGIDKAMAAQATPVGIVSYLREIELGMKPDVLYCYDLEVSADFQPRCTDGEVDEFMLLPVEEVADIVNTTDEFKLNCNLVVIDFLIRHGFIRENHPDYLALCRGLRSW